jgi:DNA uptake protein ComE-like DNA-binding protein
MMTVSTLSEYTYKPSGVKVSVLSVHDDGEYMMVRSETTGKVFFAHKNQLVGADGDNKEAKVVTKRGNRRQLATATPVVATEDRVNINTATPQKLTQVLKGVGLKTATEIKELQQSLPGERFMKLDQLRSIAKVDWDAVLEDGAVYVE